MTHKIPPAWQIPSRDNGRRPDQPIQVPLHVPSPLEIPPEYRRGPNGDPHRERDGGGRQPYTFPMGGEDGDDDGGYGYTIRMS